MNKKSSLICTLSLITGIASCSLGVISFILFIFSCLGRIPDVKDILRVLFFVMISLAAGTAIVSIVLGVIGIRKNSEDKRKAIIGVVLSSVMLAGSGCFYCFALLRPSSMNFIFYLL